MRFLDDAIDRVNRHQDRQRRQGCRFMVLAALGVVVLGVVMMIIGAILAWIEERNVVSTYGDQIASLCDPVPAGTDSLDNAPQGDAPFQLLLLRAGTGQRHSWFEDVSEVWRAEAEADVDLVACVEEVKETIETCEYIRAASRGEGTFTIRLERVQNKTTITLLNPDSGRRIDQLELEGTLPDPCPEDNPEITTSGTIDGGALSFADMAVWVEPFVFGETSSE